MVKMRNKEEIIDTIEKVWDERNSYYVILGTIIATLTLEYNQNIIPEELKEIIKAWAQQFYNLETNKLIIEIPELEGGYCSNECPMFDLETDFNKDELIPYCRAEVGGMVEEYQGKLEMKPGIGCPRYINGENNV